ncbi:MAG: ABC transporter permease [Clostridia bacterium]|nr:ABC transporter permease [Clostridia bacterium]
MTKFIQSFKMAMRSISGNKGRSALTMLGIIIGVASVIILTGIGEGSTKAIRDKLASMGTNLVTVSLTRGMQGSRIITVDDVTEFAQKNTDLIASVSPLVSSTVTTKYGDVNSDSTTLEGVSAEYKTIKNVTLASGRFITDSEVEDRANVAVVGSYIQKEYFGGLSPIGEEIKINGQIFTIIGVYEETSDSTEESTDNKVTIPYTKATRLIKNKYISTFYVSAASEDAAEDAVTALKAFMTKKLGTDSGFRVQSQKEMLETMSEMTGVMTNMLAGIAAISLVVGGIGIMNIMLVSVSERTREIGIRKAIGARTSDILLQFLIESTVVSAMGGVIGIALGIGSGAGVGSLISIEFVTKMSMVILSFLFALFVGIFFGLYPAKKASKLNPIEALRSE